VFVEQPWLAMDNNTAERALRPAVVGRKNFYGSGSQWSGQLSATMYSVLMTAKLWGLNARTWLSAYLHACAEGGNRAPSELSAFLPWAMDAGRLKAMRAVRPGRDRRDGIDTS
jgi:transposase